MSKTSQNQRNPKVALMPPGRNPRVQEDPSSVDKEAPAWQFHRRDMEHRLWGWHILEHEEHNEIINSLCSFEKLTWHEIKSQAGGKGQGKGTNHHNVPREKFVKEAKDRLQELKLDDYDEIFSLRLGNTKRLYGIKDGRILRFIWHDRYHGSKDGAYPTAK